MGRIDDAVENPVAEIALAILACLGASVLVFGVRHHPWLTVGAILVAYGALFVALFRRSRRLEPDKRIRHAIVIAAILGGVVLGAIGGVGAVFWFVDCSCLG
jgi:drug/metabolite transporter (DMT)-like permease